jgi:hypothetical protein
MAGGPAVVACVVSVNYGAKLALVLERAMPALQHAFVVTAPADAATRAVCAAYGPDRVTVLFHHFRHRGAAFDKGCAVRAAQRQAHLRFPRAFYLILDADTIVPRDFGAVLARARLQTDTLYGVRCRWDVRRLSDLRAARHEPHYDPLGSTFIGFFQLYKHARTQEPLYQHSHSAGKCDDDFRELFPRGRRATLPIEILHLGVRGRNWDGIKEEDFVFDVK